jgi:uncharacterized protein YbjT (DUF2867 family)
MTVLVTGATGNVGSAVVRELLARGVAVRAFVRDRARAAELLGADVDPAVGDLSDRDAIARAMADVRRVFLSSADGPDKVAHEANVVDAAAAAGVELVVKASTLAAQAGSPLAPLDWNGRSEAHLRGSGVPATILGSGFYMTNLLAAAPRDGRLFAPAGRGRVAMIDPRDIGAVAAAVLTEDGHAGRAYTLTGPEAISYARIAQELSLATGTEIEYVDVPEEAAREGLVAAGMPDWLVDHLIGAFRLIRADAFAETAGDVRRICGREPRSFAEFARDHADAFRQAALRP